ncbi:probable calcium-binding protein CML31 [Cajanus cajan]|nr:probable calcium-binding protein CML31 [Cajanus cajan]
MGPTTDIVFSPSPTCFYFHPSLTLYFDDDGDGKISASEQRKRLGGEVLLKEAEMAIEALDSDGDGLLCLEDLVKLMEEVGEEDKLKDLREAFDLYDTERSGFITPKALKRMLHKLGESKSTKECKAMISAFDLNGDGMLSFQEFTIMMN